MFLVLVWPLLVVYTHGHLLNLERNGWRAFKIGPYQNNVITVVVMSEPCISKSAHNYNCFLYDTKEELQQLQVTQGIPIFVGIKNN